MHRSSLMACVLSVSLLASAFAAPKGAVVATASGEVEVAGTLRRNSDGGPDAPPFAVVDAGGKVVGYLRPDSGVRIDPFVGQHVQIAGENVASGGKLPELLIGAVEGTADEAKNSLEAVAVIPVAEKAESEAASPSDVRRTAHQEKSVIPEPMFDGPIPSHSAESTTESTPRQLTPQDSLGLENYADGHCADGSCSDGACSSCNGGGCASCGGCGVVGNGWYLRGEWLYWWTEGMYTPALVTTSPSGTPLANAGVLGVPGTSVLFGQSSLNNDGRSGARISFGRWFDDCGKHAIEGDYFHLGKGSDNYLRGSLGDPILMRPYFDITGATESAEIVAFPGTLTGSVAVDTLTRFQGAGIRKRWRLCCTETCDPCGIGGYGWRSDITLGYRFYRLDDKLNIRENLTSVAAGAPGGFIVNDYFATSNYFNGAELGGILSGRRGRWSLELLGRMGLGATHSRVNIDGYTDITQNGRTTRNTGGLLAQRTNIGSYLRDDFAMTNELNATLGYQLNQNWRVTFGYTFLYWSNVVRAGQQIDRDINENLLPPETVPFTGVLRPAFHFQDTDFWAMGLNLGLDARW